MNLSAASQVLSKINELSRIDASKSGETIKYALTKLLSDWCQVLAVAEHATDDELFFLNTSRATLSECFTLTLVKDFYDTDHEFTRYVLRICLELLTDYVNVFVDQNSTFFVSNICLIMLISSTISSSLTCEDIDLFTENEIHLLDVMRQYVDKDLTHDNLTDGILSFIWNLTDNTMLVPLFLKTGYAKSIIDWIRTCRKKFREDKQIALLSILVNILRHDDGIDEFNKFDTMNAIENIPNESDQFVQRSMIDFLLNGVQHMRFDSIKILDELFRSIINASKDSKYRCVGAHICELLTALTKLLYNDKILVEFLCRTRVEPLMTTDKIIEFFTSILTEFYPNLSLENNPLNNFTCVLLFNVVWRISCHEEYRSMIPTDETLMNIVKSAANNEKISNDSFMPRTMKSMQEAAMEIQTILFDKN
ncbi:unnamed protein product [Adineta ricciae]|uniref:SPIN90/Ldb17 leucine-rich domain-containing protein n=1 Tax=Adineta ricciae TaxID=249248 RepID=A0A815Q0J9_ADIRI|nr:unnamed protein product [Adineta ricciae]CAF1456908.1 unnamed protein product [Adineta ricciae]